MSVDRLGMPVSAVPKGLALGRYCKAIGMARGNLIDAAGFVEGQRYAWGTTPEVYSTIKGAVDALSTGDPGGLATARAVGALLLPLVRANALADRLDLRRVPLNIRVPVFSGDANAHDVAEGMAKPLSKFSLAMLTLTPRKVAGDIVVTNDLLRLADATAEAGFGNELVKAVAARMDLLFADPNVGGSIANGATTISSSGGTVAQLDSDFRAALDLLAATGDEALGRAVWIMSSATAIYLASLRTTNGPLAFPTVTARGGTLSGLPIFTSAAMTATGSPSESAVLLVDPQQILFGDTGQAQITVAKSATVQLSDTPATDASAVETSLFIADLQAIRGERWAAWSRVADSSVVVLDNIQFAA